jgi:hypothetical protein
MASPNIEAKNKVIDIITNDPDLIVGGVHVFKTIRRYNPGGVASHEAPFCSVSLMEEDEEDVSTGKRNTEIRIAIRIYVHHTDPDEYEDSDELADLTWRLRQVLMKKENRHIVGLWIKSKFAEPSSSYHRVEKRLFSITRLVCIRHHS